MIISGLLGKVSQLIGTGLTRKSKIYDVSKSKIQIAGINIDALVQFQVSADEVTKQELGISKEYYAYYSTFQNLTLTFSVLPIADCIDILRALAVAQYEKKGWVWISVWENGDFVGRFKGHLISSSNVSVQQTRADNPSFTFGILESPIDIETNSFSNPFYDPFDQQ